MDVTEHLICHHHKYGYCNFAEKIMFMKSA
jgi:hypothetical protein